VYFAMDANVTSGLSQIRRRTRNSLRLQPVSRMNIGSFKEIACCILLVFFVLGCMMDSMAIILIFVPLFAPIVVAQGYDLVWFGVIVVVATEIAMITPPIGMNVFVLKAVLPDVKIQAIFKGLIPFIAADTIRLAVLVLVPGLSLWLGSTL